jgi:hypothetical protein
LLLDTAVILNRQYHREPRKRATHCKGISAGNWQGLLKMILYSLHSHNPSDRICNGGDDQNASKMRKIRDALKFPLSKYTLQGMMTKQNTNPRG